MMTFELEFPLNFKPNHSRKRTQSAVASYFNETVGASLRGRPPFYATLGAPRDALHKIRTRPRARSYPKKELFLLPVPPSDSIRPAANEMNNLNAISIVKFCADPVCATNNLAVDFNCQPHGWKFELVDQLIQ